jgi:GTPase SAR1 family protein
VGKMSIVPRLTEATFVLGTKNTVGIDYVTTIQGQTVKLVIWDTVGQERFYEAIFQIVLIV